MGDLPLSAIRRIKKAREQLENSLYRIKCMLENEESKTKYEITN